MHHFTCEKYMKRFLEQQTWRRAAVNNAARKMRLKLYQGQASLEYIQTQNKYVDLRSSAPERVPITKKSSINYSIFNTPSLSPEMWGGGYVSKHTATTIQAMGDGIKQETCLANHFHIRQHQPCHEILHFHSRLCHFSQIPTQDCSDKLQPLVNQTYADWEFANKKLAILMNWTIELFWLEKSSKTIIKSNHQPGNHCGS